ncbi:MAG: YncE family protein [Actinomycetes bacterium]
MAACLAAGSLLLSGIAPAGAAVAVTPDATPRVNGTVWAVAQVGNRTIIGGDFTTVGGVARQNIAALTADGKLDQTFNPGADGIVYALAGSADGTRVFAGGVFLNAGGQARARLAALDATTGAAVPTWTANTDGDVLGLATAGDRLYVAGRFLTIKDANRRRLAAVDASTGAVQLGFNPWPNWTVKAVAVSPDTTKVYAVGGFTAIGGATRNQGAAELLASNGSATAFAPTKGGTVLAMALSPDGSRLYYSTPDNQVFAYAPALSNAPIWIGKGGGDTQAIAASSTEVYVGGHFSQLWSTGTKLKRERIGSFGASTGAVTAWNPGADGFMGVWAMGITPTHLLVGGDFSNIGGAPQRGFARFAGTP